MRINNLTQLRDFVADQLEKLCEGKIKPEQANAASMLSANILLSLKLEMEYSKLKHEPQNIKFIEDGKTNGKLIDGKVKK